MVARIDQLANEMKDKNTGSPNTVPTAEHAQKMETKLHLAKSVIKMLMQPYHATGSASVGTGSPRPVNPSTGVNGPTVGGYSTLSRGLARALFGPARGRLWSALIQALQTRKKRHVPLAFDSAR